MQRFRGLKLGEIDDTFDYNLEAFHCIEELGVSSMQEMPVYFPNLGIS